MIETEVQQVITCRHVSSSHGVGYQVSLVPIEPEELHGEGDFWSPVELVQPDLGGGVGLGEVEGLGEQASSRIHQVVTVRQPLQVANIERLESFYAIKYFNFVKRIPDCSS